MANKYVDLEAGLNTNDGSTWALAFKTVKNALTDVTNGAVAGDRIFVRRTNAGVPGTELPASNVTYDGSAGTTDDPIWVIGVKDGTTAEPPTDSDIARQSAGDAQPETVGSSGSGKTTTINSTSDLILIGLHLGSRVSANNFAGRLFFHECEIEGGDKLRLDQFGTSDEAGHIFSRCKISTSQNAFTMLIANSNGSVDALFLDVVLNFTGTNPTSGLLQPNRATMRFIGCDLSSWGSGETFIWWGAEENVEVFLTDCKLWPAISLAPGDPKSAEASLFEMRRCTDGTKTAGQSFIQYHRQTRAGVCRASTAVKRTGGASDGASGAWSLELEPNVNKTLEGAIGVRSDWLMGWVAGDGATTKTVTVFFNNDSGADLTEGDVLIRLFSPPGDGDAQAKMSLSYTGFLGTATALTDDVASTWTGLTAGGNPQKAVFTLSGADAPDYEGPIYAQVEFQKRYAAAPAKLYVDPKLSIA